MSEEMCEEMCEKVGEKMGEKICLAVVQGVDWTSSPDLPKEVCSCVRCKLLVRDGHNTCFSRP